MKTIGQYTYCPTQLTVHYDEFANLTIGKFCSFAHNVQILLGGEHHTDWITTHPINYLFKPYEKEGVPTTKGDVNIGNDVWIGWGVIILSGVTISDGAVVGAGAVVAKDIGPYEIWVGNPARKVKRRFCGRDIELLLKIRWWDWSDFHINEVRPLLQSSDVQGLVDYYERHCSGLESY